MTDKEVVAEETEEEAEEETEELVEVYEPEPLSVHEESVVIFDPVEFAEMFDALAVKMWDGNLLYLARKSRQWVNVSPSKSSGKPKVTSIN